MATPSIRSLSDWPTSELPVPPTFRGLPTHQNYAQFLPAVGPGMQDAVALIPSSSGAGRHGAFNLLSPDTVELEDTLRACEWD